MKDAEVFTDKARLLELIRPLRETGADVLLEKDEEHGVFDIVLQTDRQRPPARGPRWATTSWPRAEYKALYSAYEEIRELDQPPLTVVDGGETTVPTPRRPGRPHPGRGQEGHRRSRATRASAR